MADKKTIANIGDQQWFLMRTYGHYLIPACAKGEACAILEVEGRTDRADIGDKRYSEFYFRAEQIASDLVAELGDHGVFVCAGDRPTEAELDAARARLKEFYSRQVFEADGEWARTHNVRMISDVQRRAAGWLGMDREWAYAPMAKVDCPGCGEKIKPAIAICPHCNSILDAEKAEKLGLIERAPSGGGGGKPRARAAS